MESGKLKMKVWFKLPFEPRAFYIILLQGGEKGNRIFKKRNRGMSAAHASIIFSFSNSENLKIPQFSIVNFQLSVCRQRGGGQWPPLQAGSGV
jgi:hypothetical protein